MTDGDEIGTPRGSLRQRKGKVREIASITTYKSLVEALRCRKDELGATFEDIDQATGLPDRYTNKLLSPKARPKKALGDMSLQLLLEALGVRLVLVEAATVAETVEARRYGKRKRAAPVRSPHALIARARVVSLAAYLQAKRETEMAA